MLTDNCENHPSSKTAFLFYFTFFKKQIETVIGYEIEHNRSCESNTKGYIYTVILVMRDHKTLRKKGQTDLKSQKK